MTAKSVLVRPQVCLQPLAPHLATPLIETLNIQYMQTRTNSAADLC